MRARTCFALALTLAVLLFGPVAQAATPEAPDPRDPADFANPIQGGQVISGYGHRGGRSHEGIDIKGSPRTGVHATFAGTVVQAGPGLSGYGNTVTIDHGRGVRTLYAHLESVSVRRGDTVAQSQRIGIQGQTGRATTYHLHYEVTEGGVHRNPAPYLR